MMTMMLLRMLKIVSTGLIFTLISLSSQQLCLILANVKKVKTGRRIRDGCCKNIFHDCLFLISMVMMMTIIKVALYMIILIMLDSSSLSRALTKVRLTPFTSNVDPQAEKMRRNFPVRNP